ncbi:replication-relaxation family protein [Domibacillus robiginosus]|uniref:replication-relaxation family protein n=1 Tax=Domibacillus robiginosus TaxID=1071054 RepID=UPI00067C2C22|nr:replication-relaxation family protein [Domibacillus robiginosus]
MSEKQVVKSIQPRDIEMLHILYQYRALSTQQLMRRFQMTSHYANKKTHVLRNSDWIYSLPILSEKGRKMGACHCLTDKGISQLQKIGIPVERKAEDLKVTRSFLPYLLSANDLMIDLAPFGWRMRDSREIKSMYGLNRGNNIHGSLISPDGTEYGFYIFMSRSLPKYIMKVVREIKESTMHNFIIFTKGQASFSDFILKAVNPGKELITGGSLKVMPYTFGKTYLQFMDNEKNIFHVLSEHDITPLSEKPLLYSAFDRLVQHDGEEKYLVSLLDTDLMKIYSLKRYRKEAYDRDQRRILVLTHMREFHQELLQDVHHIDYEDIHPSEIQAAGTVTS